MDLTNEDVADVLAVLDSLPYDELDLQTPRFRLILRRTPDGWTQSVQTRSAPTALELGPEGVAGAPRSSAGVPTAPPGPSVATSVPQATPAAAPGLSSAPATGPMEHWAGYNRPNVASGRSGSSADGADEGKVATEALSGEALSGEAGAGEAGAGEAGGGEAVTGTMGHRPGPNRLDGPSSRLGLVAGEAGGASGAGEELVAVRAPLPGTFYRAPRPGASPFVEVGGRVGTDTVVGIVETMKLMNSVTAGVVGTVAEICLGNAEFAALGATLLRIRAD